jgi:hypothetical protein
MRKGWLLFWNASILRNIAEHEAGVHVDRAMSVYGEVESTFGIF